MRTTAAGATHKLDAEATSGAGSSGDVGIAGSLALNLVDIETLALIHSAPGRGPPTVTLTGSTPNVSMTATSSVESNAKATATEDGTGGTVGIGASVAINSVDDITTAGLEDSVQARRIRGDGRPRPDAHGDRHRHDDHDGRGRCGGRRGRARSGRRDLAADRAHRPRLLPARPCAHLSGKLDAQATQTASSTTSAKGAAKAGASSTLAVGAALALVVADDQVSANPSAT